MKYTGTKQVFSSELSIWEARGGRVNEGQCRALRKSATVKKSPSEDLTFFDIVGDVLCCTNSSKLELDYEKQYDRGSCQTLLCPRWVLHSEVAGQS